MSERTPAERGRDLVARQLARQARVARPPRRTPGWRWALAALLIAGALAAAASGAFGQATAAVAAITILVAAAFVA